MYFLCDWKNQARFLLFRIQGIARRHTQQHVALALRKWWRLAAAGYYEETVVGVNLAADRLVRDLQSRLEVAETNLSKRQSEVVATSKAAAEVVERLEKTVEVLKEQANQRLQDFEQTRQELLDARRTETQVLPLFFFPTRACNQALNFIFVVWHLPLCCGGGVLFG